MSNNSKKNLKYPKFQRSADKSTAFKISRNLQEDFDRYTLKQQSAQYQNSNHQDLENPRDSLNFRETENSRVLNSSNKKYSNKNNFEKENLEYLSNQIPQSYLLAMQSLQQAVGKKDQKINDLKEMLLQKQETIFENQMKINSVLQQYRQLCSFCDHQTKQIQILKAQLKEARVDQDCAVKQAAKAMHKNMNYQNFHGFVSLQDNIHTLPLFDIPLNPLINAQQYLPEHNVHNIDHRVRANTIHTGKSYSKNARKLDYEEEHIKNDIKSTEKDHPIQYLQEQKSNRVQPGISNNISQLLSCRSSALLTNPPCDKIKDSKNINYISYQRQILRAEKQLIALNYRMECLQRSLLTTKQQKNSKKDSNTDRGNNQRKRGYSHGPSSTHKKSGDEENIKKRMREVGRQIQEKERILISLKAV